MENIGKALDLERIGAKIAVHRIGDEEAKTLGLMGSPSLRINGTDVLPGDIPGFA